MDIGATLQNFLTGEFFYQFFVANLEFQTIGDVDTTLAKTVQDLGIHISKTELKMNIRPLLRIVCSRFFGDFSGLVDMISEKIPAAKHGNTRIIQDAYTGNLKTDFVSEMTK